MCHNSILIGPGNALDSHGSWPGGRQALRWQGKLLSNMLSDSMMSHGDHVSRSKPPWPMIFRRDLSVRHGQDRSVSNSPHQDLSESSRSQHAFQLKNTSEISTQIWSHRLCFQSGRNGGETDRAPLDVTGIYWDNHPTDHPIVTRPGKHTLKTMERSTICSWVNPRFLYGHFQ